MKAIVSTRTGLTEGLQLKEVEKPVPGDHEVLIRVYASTVTAGDVVLRNLPGFLYWAPVQRVLGIPPRKTTPGHEYAGEVEAVGRQVIRFSPGDQVFGTTTGLVQGANAEYVCVPESWASGVLAHKPARVAYEQAAALPVGGMTALYLLRQANIQQGQRVLVYGASGSVGTYAVQLARYFGAEVTGVCGSSNLVLVKSLGADQVIDYTKDDLAAYPAAYDVVFDAVGKITAKRGKLLLKEGGQFVSIRSTTHEQPEALVFLSGLLESGAIWTVIDRSYPLAATGDAYRYVAAGHKSGNVVITVMSMGLV